LDKPTFTHPTQITNQLFPIAKGDQVVQLGQEEGKPLRVEVTTLPQTLTVTWGDQSIETVVSQYVAYRGDRILEVANDYYAQADDGSVWYLGETVDNYKDGVVADHEGSWLAGEDGPAGMIMPADPHAGDAYRPENIPDLVFEEVTVQDVDKTVDGPRGPVKGAVFTEEHQMDGAVENKVFAPGYGEFRAEASDERVTVAIAAPADSMSTRTPSSVTRLSASATEAFDAAGRGDWVALSAMVDAMASVWDSYRGSDDVPELLDTQMSEAVAALKTAVSDQYAEAVQQAAVDVATAVLDLELVYSPPAIIDMARLDVMGRQVLIDAAAEDGSGVLSDVAILETMRDRVRPGLDPVTATSLDDQLQILRTAADQEDFPTVADGATALRLDLATS
jgi:hypothetical protein